MGLPKCFTCSGCIHPIWIENNRFFYCDFCKQYYAGQTKNLYVVENPYLVSCPTCNELGYVMLPSIEEVVVEDIDADLCPSCNGNRKIDRRTLENAG